MCRSLKLSIKKWQWPSLTCVILNDDAPQASDINLVVIIIAKKKTD